MTKNSTVLHADLLKMLGPEVVTVVSVVVFICRTLLGPIVEK